MEEVMTGTTSPKSGQETARRDSELRREQVNLDHRYGRIGISAVAAALPYITVAKKPAHAPVAVRIDSRFIEAVV